MIGKQILHYKILEKLGEGGMGVVYKAEDTKLKREVALKFLPTNALQSKEEKERFTREAQAAAALNHANIAHVYAIEEFDGQMFITMEYIEGQDLVEMLHESPLRLNDAINYASQIAGGLQTAHEKGVIHRDIKSANIIVTDKGVVKIMDFGLAKLANRSKMTIQGSTLGTAAYMSPEQAQGQELDKRSDIWSLGVVLYEMISGQLPFKGDYEQAVIYSILNEEPEPLTALRTGVPMSLERVVMKTMAKNPDERYQHVEEIPVDLEAALKDADLSEKSRIAAPPKLTSQPRSSWRNKNLSGVVLSIGLLAIGFIVGRFFFAQSSKEVLHFRFGMSELTELLTSTNKYDADILALAPDDRVLAYMGEQDGFPGIFIHDFRQLGPPRRLQGTEHAKRLAFSPNGGALAFSGAGGIHRVSISGGAPTRLAEGVPEAVGIFWAEDGYVYYAPNYGEGIWRVSSQGGQPEQVTKPDLSLGEVGHTNPQLLPGANLLLVGTYGRGLRMQIIDLRSGARTPLSEGGLSPRYVPPGFIVFVQGNSLMAMPFDIDKVSGGRPFVVIETLSARNVEFRAQYSISSSGSLAYISGSPRWNSGLVTRNFDGSSLPIPIKKPGIELFRLSPSLNFILLAAVGMTSDTELWLYDLVNDDLRQLTFHPAWDSFGLWQSDERRIIFASERLGRADIYQLDLRGGGEPILVHKDDTPKYPTSISPDGKSLAFHRSTKETGYDAWILSLADPNDQQPVATSSYNEEYPVFSPNGKWLAYQSDESDREEVYVVAYPEIGIRQKVSDSGGSEPKWSPDGLGLYYREKTKLKRIDVRGDTFSSPRVVLDRVVDDWQLRPDGRGIITMGQGAAPELRLSLNWHLELQRAAANFKKNHE